MNSRPKALPTDAETLKTAGGADWLRSPYWPISDEMYGRLANLVLDRFDEVLADASDEDFNALLTDANFCGFLIEHIHALAVIKYCTEGKLELLVGRDSSAIYRPDWAKLANVTSLPARTIGRAQLIARQVGKTLIYGNHRGLSALAKSLFRRADCWSLGSISKLQKDFQLESRVQNCAHIYASLLPAVSSAKERICAPVGVRSAIERMLLSVRDDIRELLGVELSAIEILDCWATRFGMLASMKDSITATSRIPQSLLVSEQANPLHRVVARAVIEGGGQVTAISHGNEIGILVNRMYGYTAMSLCHKFVCPSSASRHLYRDLYALSGASARRPVEFVSTGSYQFEAWSRASSRISSKRQAARAVMVIGAPLTPYRYVLSQGDFFAFSVDLEIQALKIAKSLGLYTIYKMHPGRVKEATGVFDEYCDEILTSPFEEVWDLAEAYIFPCMTSSTFGLALSTTKRISVINVEGQRWNPKVYPLLSRRCSMIPAQFDSQNRLVLDRDALQESLMRTDKVPEMEYVETFMTS
jgi:hypothetical protein